eukprot:2161111-Prymnesium_polylepis.1
MPLVEPQLSCSRSRYQPLRGSRAAGGTRVDCRDTPIPVPAPGCQPGSRNVHSRRALGLDRVNLHVQLAEQLREALNMSRPLADTGAGATGSAGAGGSGSAGAGDSGGWSMLSQRITSPRNCGHHSEAVPAPHAPSRSEVVARRDADEIVTAKDA